MKLSYAESGLERDSSEYNYVASFITMESAEFFTRGKTEEFMKSIKIIGDILREQVEFHHDMELYSDALQMLKSMEASHKQPNEDIDVTITLYEMGVIHLQMQERNMALV